jgi:hypothetical protein
MLNSEEILIGLDRCFPVRLYVRLKRGGVLFAGIPPQLFVIWDLCTVAEWWNLFVT